MRRTGFFITAALALAIGAGCDEPGMDTEEAMERGPGMDTVGPLDGTMDSDTIGYVNPGAVGVPADTADVIGAPDTASPR